MFVEIASTTVISACGTLVINLKNGAVISQTQLIKKRLKEIRKSPQIVKYESDLELLERGIIQFKSQIPLEDSNYIARVKNLLKNTGGLCLMTTEKCNLRCTYCYEKFIKGRMSNDLIDAVCIYLETNVPRFSAYQLAWFGGEPLLHPDIIKRVNSVFRTVLKKTEIQGTISITTNGTLFTPKILDLFVKDSVDVVQITIDGPKEVHDSQRKTIRGFSTYQSILDNIEVVLNETNTTVLIRVNVASDDESLCIRVREWLATEIIPRFLKYKSRVKYNVISIWNATTKSINGICIADVQRFLNWINVTNATWVHDDQPLESFIRVIKTTGNLACYAGKPNHYVIGSDGTVYKCTVALDLPSNKIGRMLSNGSLEIKKGAEDIWVTNNSLNDSVCFKCALREPCVGIACPLVRIQDNRQPCPTEKKYLPLYLEKLSAYENEQKYGAK